MMIIRLKQKKRWKGSAFNFEIFNKILSLIEKKDYMKKIIELQNITGLKINTDGDADVIIEESAAEIPFIEVSSVYDFIEVKEKRNESLLGIKIKNRFCKYINPDILDRVKKLSECLSLFNINNREDFDSFMSLSKSSIIVKVKVPDNTSKLKLNINNGKVLFNSGKCVELILSLNNSKLFIADSFLYERAKIIGNNCRLLSELNNSSKELLLKLNNAEVKFFVPAEYSAATEISGNNIGINGINFSTGKNLLVIKGNNCNIDFNSKIFTNKKELGYEKK